MIKTVELVLPPKQAADKETQRTLASQLLSVPADSINHIHILKRSIDARGRQVKIRLATEVFIDEQPPSTIDYGVEFSFHRDVSKAEQVVIIGCGPAGMFAALRLIELGFKPVIIERGKDVRSRRHDLAAINKLGAVNPDSNYCFGEGGAGTYSDGKLYTRSSKRGDVKRILKILIAHGATEEISVDAHPHIGTDKLPQLVQALRETIIAAGGEIHFNTCFTDFILENNSVKGITALSGTTEKEFKGNAVILATGHSARDIFYLLKRRNILIEAKPFALGVRIEHPQHIIDSMQYHCEVRDEYLPPASYSITTQVGTKGVYSFCMCPGGIIAPAATDSNEVVVNGWSPSRRNNPFANSGFVASVDEQDYKRYSNHEELAALQYQIAVEQKAFEKGSGNLKAPAQRLVDFANNTISADLPECSYNPGIVSRRIDEVLPTEITAALRNALKFFAKKIRPYYTNEAVLVATESRTSSPVRIPRDKETLEHPQIKGLFPCGEGAGYAGGIVSAAMDGERCAEAVVILHSHGN